MSARRSWCSTAEIRRVRSRPGCRRRGRVRRTLWASGRARRTQRAWPVAAAGGVDRVDARGAARGPRGQPRSIVLSSPSVSVTSWTLRFGSQLGAASPGTRSRAPPRRGTRSGSRVTSTPPVGPAHWVIRYAAVAPAARLSTPTYAARWLDRDVGDEGDGGDARLGQPVHGRGHLRGVGSLQDHPVRPAVRDVVEQRRCCRSGRCARSAVNGLARPPDAAPSARSRAHRATRWRTGRGPASPGRG